MNLENPIHQLTDEHRYILKVVHALRVIEADLSRSAPIDVALVRKAIQFMRDFADRCHHAKEEAVLFPAMEEKGVPKGGCPLGGLKAEHDKGRKLVAQLEAAVGAYAAGQPGAAEQMRDAIDAICLLYPNHIWKEDEMVFPMAERLFSPDELQRLKQDFEHAEQALGLDHQGYQAFADEMEALIGREHV